MTVIEFCANQKKCECCSETGNTNLFQKIEIIVLQGCV